MDEAMVYELFIRKAFGVANENGRINLLSGNIVSGVERNGDPAKLATTDVFASKNLSATKAGAGYAMCIFNDAVISQRPDLKETCYELLDSLMNSRTVEEIARIIENYKEKILDQCNS